MANIYDLTTEAAALRDSLFFDEEDEILLAKLDAVEESIEKKLNWIISYIAIEEQAAAIEDAKLKLHNEYGDSIRRNRDSKNSNVARLKKLAMICMDAIGTTKFSGDWLSIRVQNNPAKVKYTDNFDLKSLPESAIVIIPEHIEPNDKEILRLLKEGEDIKGAVLEVTKRLQKI